MRGEERERLSQEGVAGFSLGHPREGFIRWEVETRPAVQWRGCGCGGRLTSHLLWEVTSLTSGSTPRSWLFGDPGEWSPLGLHSCGDRTELV